MKNEFISREKIFDLIYAFVLFTLLLMNLFPYLSTPARSDYWQMFYFFHHLDELPGHVKWVHILNYDVFEQMRYQPFSRLYYYFLHRLVGSNFFFFNLSNFGLYFLSAFIIYKFALNFSKNRVLAAVLVGLFAFLFSHFDIVLWSYHIYIIAGLCMFLLGFMGYIKFLKTGRLSWLYLVVLLSFSGMLCYEPFFLWPLAIIILSSIKSLKTDIGPAKKRIIKANCLVLITTYILYLSFYLFTRMLRTYDQPLHEISSFLGYRNFILSGFLALFNIFYNNIILNIYPLLSFPLKVAENIELGGPIISLIEKKPVIIVFSSIFLGICLISLALYLTIKKHFEEIKIIVFLLFLTLSQSYVLFFCRLITNEFEYSLRQFRYLYISNAVFILIAIFVVDKFFGIPRIKRKISYSILLMLIFFLNIFCIQKVENIYKRQFLDLSKMLSNIKAGIRGGTINQDNKLYLQNDIPDYLPILCWNIEMGERFIEGNYQWLFPKKEIKYFSKNLKDAAWVIDTKDFSLIKKSPENLTKKGLKINSIINEDYIDLGKDRKFVELGYFLIERGRLKEAVAMFERALELNPKSDGAYSGLGRLYNEQQRYPEAEAMFKKALELNPRSEGAYTSLGHFYNSQQRYPEAEAMFKKALELSPKSEGAHNGLGHLYNEQQRYPEAEAMFKKALELRPQDAGACLGLGYLYSNQQKYPEAEAMFKKALELNPESEGAYTGLGHFYNSQQRYPEAEAMFKKALELNPENDGAYNGLGHLYNEQQKYPEAEAMLKKALELNPRNSGAYTGLGNFHNNQQRYPEAEAMFKKALELNFRNIGAYNGLGYLYRNQGKYQEAEEMFKKARELNNPNVGK